MPREKALCFFFFYSPVSAAGPRLFFFSFFQGGTGADKSEEEILQEQLQLREDNLWQKASKDFQTGKDRDAADNFLQYYRQYSDSPRAEEAL